MSLIEGDVEKKEKILKLIKKFGPFVSILAYIAGVVYFCLLPHQMLIHGTYVSENALLPGLVNSDIHSSESLFSYYETLKSSYENKKEMDLDLIKSLFSSKIETYFQQFNVSNPFLKNFREFNQELYTRKGRNLYALSRAQRADGTESIVITAPLYVSTNKKEKQTPNLMGISMLLVIAEISKMKPYWAKDLIFVVPEMSEVGMQAWINSYYDIQSEYIKSENLNRRGGSIQAALNLEFADSEANKIELKLEGPNGKLPNLDLFNTVIRVCRSVHFECSLEAERGTTAMASQDEYYGYRQQPRPYLDHLDGLENTLAMVFRQATGAPSSLHGFFLNHRIEALTFKGSKLLKSERTTKKSTPKQNLLKAIQVVEGTMRSVNNLLERFHQSFFFYLLPSSHYYISIGMYMPAFGLIVLPLLVQILTIWFSIFYKQAANESNKGETSLFLYNLFRMVLAKLFIASAFGLLLYFGTPYFVYFGKKLQLGARESLINCYIAIVVNILGSAILINLKMEPPEKKEENNAENNRIYLFETGEKLIRLLGLLGLTIFLGTLSLLNFSLAFLIALFYVPASIFVIQPFKNKLIKLVQMIFWLVATPIVYFFLLYCFHEYYYSNLDSSRFLSLFDSAFDKFYSLVIMNKISNIWTYDLVNLGLIPIWALFWFITFPKL